MKLPTAIAALLIIATALGSGLRGSEPVEARSGWEYTALGDSLATGLLAFRGYVPRYKDYVQTDTGFGVNLNNLGQNGSTSNDLLKALKTNRDLRRSVARSQVVTWDIGGNDLRAARNSYKAQTCGGADNQDCLRNTTATFKGNWDAIIVEILSLRNTSNTIIRSMDIYNPYVNEDQASDSWTNDGGLNDFQVFKVYVDRANSHIAATAQSKSIRVAGVYAAFNGTAGDQDPSDKG